jgi:transcriptional regulator
VFLPSHFSISDPREVARLLTGIGAADLVTVTDDGLTSSFLPLLFVPGAGIDGSSLGSLHGHLARSNRQWKSADGSEALVIAHFVDGYISPNGYPSKTVDGKVVPTWNYVTLNVHGRIIVHDDPAWTLDVVRRLTDVHEARHAARRTTEPWSVDDAPADYIDTMLKAIVGIEVVIDRIEAKAKLSQNKAEADALGAATDLELGGPDEAALAAAMRKANRPARRIDPLRRSGRSGSAG